MKRLCTLATLSAVIFATPLAGCNVPDDEKMASEMNVNSRYIVENVVVSSSAMPVNISDPLRSDIDKVVGSKYDDSTLKHLADQIRKELHVNDVAVKVTRGSEPDHVVVNFEVTRANEHVFDLSLGQFLYDSREGWSGDGGATVNVAGNAISFGLVSNADTFVERYAGVHARFERKHLGTDRLKLRFDFASYHDIWNLATIEAASPNELYRTRQVFTPEATLVIAEPLEWSFGVSFARLSIPGPVQTEGAGAAAAKTEASNAVVNTLRYHQRWGSETDPNQQAASAQYVMTAATDVLGTDGVFTKHEAKARYKYRHDRSSVEVGFLAGTINGAAPLYDRFVLGDSTTLRGWSKFDLDPLGGSHVIHGSIDYQYRIFQVFYDTGAVWDRPEQREQKQSVGVGLRRPASEGKAELQVAMAFPIRSGRVDPIFYAGMNF
ncbi:MAG TPA: BamA/TamA family outer membrane protein [Bryobacteraceae bacterium]|nr:BamA/TamA family outer membrane protein [Bryobacteraceae bacterium]